MQKGWREDEREQEVLLARRLREMKNTVRIELSRRLRLSHADRRENAAVHEDRRENATIHVNRRENAMVYADRRENAMVHAVRREDVTVIGST